MSLARKEKERVSAATLAYPPGKEKWHYCMEEIPGSSFHKVVNSLGDDELDHIAIQLKSHLDEMQRVKSDVLGSVARVLTATTSFRTTSLLSMHLQVSRNSSITIVQC